MANDDHSSWFLVDAWTTRPTFIQWTSPTCHVLIWPFIMVATCKQNVSSCLCFLLCFLAGASHHFFFQNMDHQAVLKRRAVWLRTVSSFQRWQPLWWAPPQCKPIMNEAKLRDPQMVPDIRSYRNHTYQTLIQLHLHLWVATITHWDRPHRRSSWH